MDLKINRDSVEIKSGSGYWTDRDIAYIEDTLGLKKDNDYVRLVRHDFVSREGISHIQTERYKKPKPVIINKEQLAAFLIANDCDTGKVRDYVDTYFTDEDKIPFDYDEYLHVDFVDFCDK